MADAIYRVPTPNTRRRDGILAVRLLPFCRFNLSTLKMPSAVLSIPKLIINRQYAVRRSLTNNIEFSDALLLPFILEYFLPLILQQNSAILIRFRPNQF